MSLRHFWNAYVAYAARLRDSDAKTFMAHLAGELVVLLALTSVITLIMGAVSGNGWSADTAKVVAVTLVAIEFALNFLALRSHKRT